jgi:hypothetical protein
MTILTDLFGPPSSDQLLESPFEPFEGWTGPDRGVDACHATTGFVCFDYIEFVVWGDLGLWVTFSDLTVNPEAVPGDEDYIHEVAPSLQGYIYSGGDSDQLAYTAEGITIGSTVAELRRVYGDAATFGLGCVEVPEFSVKDPSSAEGNWFRGSLEFDEPYEWKELDSGHVDPESLDPDATVRQVEAGAQSSC